METKFQTILARLALGLVTKKMCIDPAIGLDKVINISAQICKEIKIVMLQVCAYQFLNVFIKGIFCDFFPASGLKLCYAYPTLRNTMCSVASCSLPW